MSLDKRTCEQMLRRCHFCQSFTEARLRSNILTFQSCTCSIFLAMVEEYFFSPGWVRLVGQNIIKKYFFSPAWARYLWGIFLIYWLSLAGWAKYLHIFMKVVKPAMAFSDALLKYQGIATERKFCESSFEYYDNIGSILHLYWCADRKSTQNEIMASISVIKSNF